MRRLAGSLLLCSVSLGLLTGCPDGGGAATRRFTTRDARISLERINSNLSRLDQPIYAKPVQVSARFRDDDGRRQAFVSQPARILFAPPQCLRFDIEHSLGGKVAEIGSNDERYWLWVEPETNTLWWGTWAALEAGTADRLIVPPDQLLSALLLQPIPTSLRDGPPPMLTGGNFGRSLEFYLLDERGWPYVAREMRLRSGDGLPSAIIDYDANGKVVMQATLSGYAPLDGTGARGPRAPRKYELRWPPQDAELTINIDRMQFFNREVPCDFPAQWRGRVVSLDYGGPRMPEYLPPQQPAMSPVESHPVEYIPGEVDLLTPTDENTTDENTTPQTNAPEAAAPPQETVAPRPAREEPGQDPLLQSLREN